jgi:acylphosphatase
MKLKAKICGSKVHDVGYRVFLLRKALEFGAERFNAQNSEEDGLQILTALIEGSKDMVEEFSGAVRSHKPVGAEVSEISFQEHKGYIIDIGDYMHLLQVEQLSKGIPALLRIDQKQDQMLDKQDELLVEVKDINRKFDKVLDKDIGELKSDMAEVKTALKAKGII